MTERVIDYNPEQIANITKMLRGYKRGIHKVLSRAVNKIATSARQEISTEVRKRLNIKSGELKRRNLTIRRASYTNPGAIIRIKGARLSLTKLGARQTQRGVSYRIGKIGGRKMAERAFIATMKSGHNGVFKRVSAMDKQAQQKISKWIIDSRNSDFDNAKSNRLPLAELKGPSVPQVFTDIAEFAKSTHERKLATRLQKELANQTKLLLEGVTK